MERAEATLHAQQAFALADTFKLKFAELSFGKKRPRRLVLSEPDGPSTAGGRVSRQNIVLVPVKEGSTTPLVVGWVDGANRRAEIRSFRVVGKNFEARHNRGIDLEPGAYDDLSSELDRFLRAQRIEVAVDDHSMPTPPDAIVERGPRESSGPMFAMLGLGFALGFGVGYLVFGL